MKLKAWPMLALCVMCVLATACTAGQELTRSGSDAWSRGVVLGETEADPVAVGVWQGTTFVAWVAEGGRVQLARLDSALRLESVTDLALTAAYPYDMLLGVETADRLHVVWLDSIEGVRTLIHARVADGEVEPVFRQELRLPDEAEHVQMAMRLEAQRLEVFWSADEHHNSGIYHQALNLAGEGATPAVQLTETGWQPGVGWGPLGAMRITWLEEGRSGYLAVWHADLKPAEELLDTPALVTQVRIRRARRFLGPAVGSAGAQTLVAWDIGWRTSIGWGRFLDPPSTTRRILAGVASYGAGSTITSDTGQYVMVTSASPEADTPIYSLTTGNVAEIWQAPRMRTVGDRTWVYFSAWVARRGDVRLQIVVLPFDGDGPGEPVAVTRTRPSSVSPDLAVDADSTLRVAWVEPLGDDLYRVAVASTAPEALKAFGGFRLADLLADVADFAFENLSLLGYAPYTLGWAILPVGILLVATMVSPGGVRGWQVAVWLGGAILLQIASKRFLAPQLLSFGPDLAGNALVVTPVALGIALMWVYWRRAREPLLLAAYGLYMVVDVFFSVFIMIPRQLWRF
jgi:hypothetical protein